MPIQHPSRQVTLERQRGGLPGAPGAALPLPLSRGVIHRELRGSPLQVRRGGATSHTPLGCAPTGRRGEAVGARPIRCLHGEETASRVLALAPESPLRAHMPPFRSLSQLASALLAPALLAS